MKKISIIHKDHHISNNKMDYNKLHNRLEHMLEYESDNYLININLKQDVADKLYDYQYLHVFNMLTALRSYNCVLDGSDTGTGKTFTSIAICKQLNLRPFIVCPKTIISNWKRVCKLFNVNPLGIINYEMIKSGKYYNNNELVDCPFITVDETYNNERRFMWKIPKYALLIFDEAHRCKNSKSQNGWLLLSTKNCDYNMKMLLLSATISDKPQDFAIFGYLLGFYNSIKKAKNWVGGMLREDKNYIGRDIKLSAINRAIYPNKGSRIRIAELGSKFPENQIVADCYDIDSSSLEEIKMLYDMISYNKKNGEQLAVINKCRQEVEDKKISIFEDLINDYLENNYNVAVFLNFKKTVYKLAKMFDTSCLITGDQEEDVKQKNISDFQNNISNIIICTSSAGGEGISLHDEKSNGRPRVSLISPNYNARELIQVLGRIHRAGSKSPALQRIIFISNTIEEDVCNKIRDKLTFTSKLNDNDLIELNLI